MSLPLTVSSMHTSVTEQVFAVIDVETTGLDPRLDRVVEVACIRTRASGIVERFATLIDPKRPISAAASAIHGICDRDVEGAPSLEDVTSELLRLADGAIVVGHNVRFDLSFLKALSGHASLCTLQLARRIVDAPDYRNETLRRFLALDVDTVGAQPHRALHDATVTESLLHKLLRRHVILAGSLSATSLLEATARPRKLAEFSFGRYRNTALSRIPTGYLRWIVEEGFQGWPDVRHTAILELRERCGNATFCAE